MDFVYLNQHVLDNLFYILVSIFLYFILVDKSERLKRYKKTLLASCLSVSMLLCMRFPIYIDEYCVHDLRQIPLLIGILYGGWPVGVFMAILLLTTRFVFYGFNLITFCVYIFIFVITTLFSRKFIMMGRKKKMVSSSLLALFIGVISAFIAVSISDFFKVTEAYIFYFMILPVIIMVCLIYIIEILNSAIEIRSKVVKLEKMEVVSQLAASISHEVRNPLTVVKGFVHLLKDPTLSNQVRVEYLDHVTRELKSAEAIISEYLAFAKPAAEQIDPILIDREIGSIIEMIKPLANMNSVQISDELTTAKVLGNSQYFKQCFLNLLKNGIEAMPDGGELRVAATKDQKHVMIRISDNGVGMTREQLDRFGEPYYSSKEKGTGLGSMVVVRTIQAMNGTLDIRSALNQGTTIIVKLPVSA